MLTTNRLNHGTFWSKCIKIRTSQWGPTGWYYLWELYKTHKSRERGVGVNQNLSPPNRLIYAVASTLSRVEMKMLQQWNQEREARKAFTSRGNGRGYETHCGNWDGRWSKKKVWRVNAEPARSQSNWADTCCSERLQLPGPKRAFLEAKVIFTAVPVFNLQAPCVLFTGQAFRYSPENAFYILINKYISLSDICLTVHHWYK